MVLGRVGSVVSGNSIRVSGLFLVVGLVREVGGINGSVVFFLICLC